MQKLLLPTKTITPADYFGYFALPGERNGGGGEFTSESGLNTSVPDQ
ncbi:MAG: hypothetical protein HY067_08180 [Betaproteobacteria bacterium]|nr:hypothetical protein [Betaproteobacteria bacterium]